jgi:hypothetical protein
LQNRNLGYTDTTASTKASNQATLNATEGATALDINTAIDKNTVAQERLEQKEINNSVNEASLENISMENAAYLQNVKDVFNDNDSKSNEDMDTFEVDSIELATPELFSDDGESNSSNQDNNNDSEPKMFENSKPEKAIEIKEPEMFEETNLEEDFEIPAFLRRQKN